MSSRKLRVKLKWVKAKLPLSRERPGNTEPVVAAPDAGPEPDAERRTEVPGVNVGGKASHDVGVKTSQSRMI